MRPLRKDIIDALRRLRLRADKYLVYCPVCRAPLHHPCYGDSLLSVVFICTTCQESFDIVKLAARKWKCSIGLALRKMRRRGLQVDSQAYTNMRNRDARFLQDLDELRDEFAYYRQEFQTRPLLPQLGWRPPTPHSPGAFAVPAYAGPGRLSGYYLVDSDYLSYKFVANNGMSAVCGISEAGVCFHDGPVAYCVPDVAAALRLQACWWMTHRRPAPVISYEAGWRATTYVPWHWLPLADEVVIISGRNPDVAWTAAAIIRSNDVRKDVRIAGADSLDVLINSHTAADYAMALRVVSRLAISCQRWRNILSSVPEYLVRGGDCDDYQ